MLDDLEIARMVSKCDAYLASQGVQIEVVSDFARINEIVEMSGKGYLTPLVSPELNDLTQGNCLWLVGWRDGLPVLLGAARLEDLGTETVKTFWPRALARLYQREPGKLISDISDEIAGELSGRIAYFGDLSSKMGAKGATLNVRSFVMMGHLLVHQKWSPNAVYAMVRGADLLRGAAWRYGFTEQFPAPITWIDPPSPRSSAEWCCVLRASRLAGVARAVMADLEACVTKSDSNSTA